MELSGSDPRSPDGEVTIDPRWTPGASMPPDTTDGSDEEIEYRPMPPKRSFEMTAYLQMRGQGKPMPFDLDDDAVE
jgi:hypothetical protein